MRSVYTSNDKRSFSSGPLMFAQHGHVPLFKNSCLFWL